MLRNLVSAFVIDPFEKLDLAMLLIWFSFDFCCFFVCLPDYELLCCLFESIF